MKRLVLALSAALLAMPALAQAQIEQEIEEIDTQPSQELEVGLNGGVGNFFGDVGDFTDTGPAYGVTATLNQTEALSYEGSFMGHTNSLDGVDSNITRNQLQAAVKVGPELEAPVMWRPYAYGGVGIGLTTVGSNPFGLTNAVEGIVPLGVGADFFTDSTFRVGLRGQYNLSILGSDVADFDEHPDGFSATLNAQAAF